MLYMHYTPFWVNLTTVASFGVGVVAGWVARLVYDKYFKEDVQNENID
nr:MAG TPA: putative integral membrane protein [Bacteriophage sp.]